MLKKPSQNIDRADSFQWEEILVDTLVKLGVKATPPIACCADSLADLSLCSSQLMVVENKIP